MLYNTLYLALVEGQTQGELFVLEGRCFVRMIHRYLRAVGFSNIKRKSELDELLKHIVQTADEKKLLPCDPEEKLGLACIGKRFCSRGGIRIYGEYSEAGLFEREFYFPYIIGRKKSRGGDFSAEKQSDRDYYVGLCENPELPVSLIYGISNGIDCAAHSALKGKTPMTGVVLSGLSIEGRILLPVKKTERQREAIKVSSTKRSSLISAARDGDPEAMESLTIGDMDLYRRISERMDKEDIFSIIDTSFMPAGLECDKYAVIGEILAFETIVNDMTDEKIWLLDVECNDIFLTVAINHKDLLGEPAVGRRFKGDISLQGEVLFD